MAFHEHILTIPRRKAEQAADRVAKLIDSGDIAYESDLLQAVTKEYVDFYNSVTRPSITSVPLVRGQFLDIEAISAPMQQLDGDLVISYEQMELLRAAVEKSSHVITTDVAGTSALLSRASAAVDALRIATADSDPDMRWSVETFKTLSRINTLLSTARIQTTLGVATLPIVSEESLASHVTAVSIDRGSAEETYVPGLPGNKLEVSSYGWASSTEETEEPVNPTFVGSMHEISSDPRAMLDGNADTWFEWERYYVPMRQKVTKCGDAYVAIENSTEVKYILRGPARPPVVAHGVWTTTEINPVTRDYGWQYVIKWPPGPDGTSAETNQWLVTPWDGNAEPSGDACALPLTFAVDFDKPQELSWVELLPYLPTTGRGTVLTCRLESVTVSPNGSDGWVELVPAGGYTLGPEFNRPLDYDKVGIPVKNYTGTAVLPCPIKTVKSIRFRLVQEQSYATKIAHKFFLKTTQHVHESKRLFSNKTNTWLETGRVQNMDLTPSDAGGKISGFGPITWGSRNTITDLSVTAYYDIFNAYRYAVGIRDLGLFRRVFGETGSVVTRPHVFTGPVKAVGLVVSETIPEGWDNTRQWVRYEISADGANWKPIQPENRTGQIGGTVEFDSATIKVYVRITMSRPDDRPNESPIVSYFTIKALPED